MSRLLFVTALEILDLRHTACDYGDADKTR
jgi:hypothetical protein